MDHNFTYRQRMRQERLTARRQAAFRKKVRALVTLCTVAFLFITVISANAVIAKAGDGYERNYQKLYTSIIVERGETVWAIASEYMTPGYESVEDLVEEIGFINGLDDAYAIKSGTRLMIPYFAES